MHLCYEIRGSVRGLVFILAVTVAGISLAVSVSFFEQFQNIFARLYGFLD